MTYPIGTRVTVRQTTGVQAGTIIDTVPACVGPDPLYVIDLDSGATAPYVQHTDLAQLA